MSLSGVEGQEKKGGSLRWVLRPKSVLQLYVLAVLLLLALMGLGFWVGAVDDLSLPLKWQLRFPRVMMAALIGAGLSVAGATLQALFANPLCEPYTLGIASGASLGAVIGFSLGFQWGDWGWTLTSWSGSLLFALILSGIALRPRSSQFLLLWVGVLLGFLGNSLVALWIALFDRQGMGGVLIWLFGDLSAARMPEVGWMACAVLGLIVWIASSQRQLDGLLLGEEEARSVGIDVRAVRTRLIALTSLLVAVCVSACGMIGFVGLVVPHAVRQMVGSLHRHLIPLVALFGASALLASDLLARVLVRPQELPVGVVTSLLGAPLFAAILFSGHRSESSPVVRRV